MSIRDQMKAHRAVVDNSRHAFLNAVVGTIQKQFKEQVPELEMNLGNKSTLGSEISVDLSGEVSGEASAIKDIKERVLSTIQNYQDPAAILDNLEK
jgi:hypothetical protein